MADDGALSSRPGAAKPRSRIQRRNRKKILEAALDVFSQHGFRGATLDQIAGRAGMSKPNMLYYFDSKEAIHVELLNALMSEWLAPLEALQDAEDPVAEIMGYVRSKMEMSRVMPRESRLFAGEILQGAPRMAPHLKAALKPLFDRKCALIRGWSESGRLAPVDAEHLLFTIWAVTQHYADFEAQVDVLMPEKEAAWRRACAHVEGLFMRLLTPAREAGEI
ncbi:TetR family transcriptional regulator C-terminal domain-containing protein [Allosediminivita pacifica]|uniref:TetR family transcriptional regulator n=1 Tax=Allosediminivita pacifica TaxID=1267769 RepID=A0A2T6AT23_9RHOB|nr:TetR family transcriptional regulator C-terminal domain-containing protein [Allosediminivita pacifica]PTX46969.1 TetR family transcriptional regulator [Allosediminivita pacifica]GGB14814.1 TetR family transcriptional regulator [Allosediminivita pacifica]